MSKYRSVDVVARRQKPAARTPATRVYYPAGGAMRANGALYYVVGDNLGSAVLTLDAAGTTVAEQRYYAFGAVRYASGSLQTDRTYTGQRSVASLGLMDYRARFYDGTLGRFISPDSIVPSMANPQAWNRFSYVLNDPTRYTDPSGHCFDGATTPICLMAAPAGPVGWALIGVLVVLDVGIITYAVITTSESHAEESPIEEHLTKKVKGEYIPPGLNDPEEKLYKDALHRYKDAWGIPPNVNVPKPILDGIARDIKKGKKPVDAADNAPEPPDYLQKKGRPR